MKIELKKTKDNHLKGWTIIPENEDEMRILGSIRNAIFFGLDDLEPKYAGITTTPDEKFVTSLSYCIPKYKNIE